MLGFLLPFGFTLDWAHHSPQPNLPQVFEPHLHSHLNTPCCLWVSVYGIYDEPTNLPPV